MSEKSIIRIAILDDDQEFREVLSMILNKSEGFKCVATYQSCAEALKKIEEDLPDILLLDIEMPGKSGIESLKEIKSVFPTVEVMMLTVYSDSEKIFQSLRNGAVGYLLKKSPTDKLLEAIREASEGGAPFSGEVARKVLQYFQTPVGQVIPSLLSEREKEVLDALVEGHSTKNIADKLFVSTHTVRFHLHNIYVKLHVNSRSEAVAKAIKNRIV
ncbi:MAG: response regulator transcription factor [Bacteroidetes bacterium]|nr:response regulator transcription factor [Bacteroidota bacterium]